MTLTLITTNGAIIAPANLAGALSEGRPVDIVNSDDETIVTMQFRPAQNVHGSAGFWVHGTPVHSISQVLDFLDGDAHDVSKVQWFDGRAFLRSCR